MSEFINNYFLNVPVKTYFVAGVICLFFPINNAVAISLISLSIAGYLIQTDEKNEQKRNKS